MARGDSTDLYRAVTALVRDTNCYTSQRCIAKMATQKALQFDVDLDDLLDGYEATAHGRAS